MPDGPDIPIPSAEFRTALTGLHVFAVEYPLGDFLVIAERRKRGDRYWVARAYHQGRRASVYLGRTIDAADLRRAAQGLQARLHAEPAIDPTDPAAPTPPPDERALDAVVRDLVEREQDPARRAAAEAIAALVRQAHPTGRA